MKNLFLYLIFLFVYSSVFAQYESGDVLYKTLKVAEKENLNLPIKFREAKRKIGEVINTFEFSLKFNRESSSFKLNERLVLDLDESINELAIITTRANRIIYTNLNEKTIIEQTSFLDKKFLIKSSFNDIHWNLTKEIKDIDGYQCYKALGVLNYSSHKGETKQLNYVVWYTPEIPFNFGPFECSGLPGLVLQFSNGKTIFTATSIKLSKESVLIEKPNEGKLVTKEEYNQIGKKVFDDNQN